MVHNIFDTHAQYDDERFDADRLETLDALPEQGVCGVVNAACDMKSAKFGITLAERYDFLWCSVGVHPHSAKEFKEEDLSLLAQYSNHPKVVAIGEIGLDYHYDFSPRPLQLEVFEKQIQLAKELNLPIIVHDREAHGDTMELLKKYSPKGIVHCYSGSADMAKEIVKLGMYIGFTGAVTFKNARKILEAAAAVPLDRLLVETDCPYMSPEPFRGTRCWSAMIQYTAQTLAQIKGVDIQKLLDITCENAHRVYNISPQKRDLSN